MKTYFKFLSKNKLYTFIEAFGLAVALGFVILLASYSRTEFSVGTKQPLSKQIYAIGTADMVGLTLGAGEEFFPSMPEIDSWTRAAVIGDADFTVNGEYYAAKACALDTNFLRIFDYRILGCSPDKILASPEEVVLSESFAKRVFGEEDPVGRILEVPGGKYTVTGVLQDFGESDIFKPYDAFFPMDYMNRLVSRMDQFGAVLTFVTLTPGTDPVALKDKLLDKYCEYWDRFERDASDSGFLYGSSLTRLDDLYFCTISSYAPLRHGDKKTVEILLLVALVLLVSAIFNYINLTVALTGKRAKEMATRRLLGESSRSIAWRYLAESLTFTAICFAVGAGVAFLFKGWMEKILSTSIVIPLDWVSVCGALALLLLIAVVSALLPAAMVSRFKPVDVVKGDFRFKSKMVFSRIFIVCQNVISTVFIAVALTMTLQMHHLVTLPTGYNTSDVLALETWSLGMYNFDAQQALSEKIAALPQVEAVGRAAQTPFRCGSNGVHVEGETTSWMKVSQLDSTCFRILGFKVVEQYSEPLDNTYWLTEEARDRYGVSESNPAVGKCDDGSIEYNVCGIIENFRPNDALTAPMDDSHNAVCNRNSPRSVCWCIMAKVTGDRKEAFAAVKNVWTDVAKEYIGVPKEPEMYYVDESLNESLTGTRNTMKLLLTFMVLSVLISALGLFAMSVYYTGEQARQIALRKIFGSGVREAAGKLSKSFAVMAAVAVVLAVPFCVWAMRLYLQGFYNRIDFPVWVIPAAAVLTFLLSFVSILFQTLKSASANPVETLKRDN